VGSFEAHFNTVLTPKELRFLSAASSFLPVSSKFIGQQFKKSSAMSSAPQRSLARVDAVTALGTAADKFNPACPLDSDDEEDVSPALLSELQRQARGFSFFSDRPALGLSALPSPPPATATATVTLDDGEKVTLKAAPLSEYHFRPRLTQFWTQQGTFAPGVYRAMRDHALDLQPVSQTIHEAGKLRAVARAQKAEAPWAMPGTPLQRMVLPLLRSYADVMLAAPNPCMPAPDWPQLQDAYLAHCLNHVLVSRDHVISHTEAISRKAAREAEAALLQRAAKLDEKEQVALLGAREDQLRAMLKGNDAEAKAASASLAVLLKSKKTKRQLKKQRSAARQAKDTDFAKDLANPLSMPTDLGMAEDVNAKYRDQGFTRARVLIIVPTRAKAYEIALRLIEMLPANMKKRVENLGQLHEDYGDLGEDYVAKENRALDYKLNFNGNHDDCFKLGIAFGNSSVRLATPLYGSDIIIGSPLGLKMTAGNEGDDDNDRRADFLSSIEVCVLDHAHAFNMQNMDHLSDVMAALNGLPKHAKDVDFSRVRPWYLDGLARFYRQTIVVAAHWSSPLLNLFHKYCENRAGRLRLRPREYLPVLRHVRPAVKHLFMRLDGLGSAEQAADAKFDLWKNELWPKIKESSTEGHTVIFVPSYLDFVRVRNHFKARYVRFGILCEFTDPRMVGSVRTEFYNGKVKFILTTERFHYFNRLALRAVRHVVWYGLPLHPHFYFDMLNFIDGAGNSAKCIKPPSSFALYTRQDAMALERIVGSEQCAEMLTSKQSMHMIAP
jgi:hypothetical protein